MPSPVSACAICGNEDFDEQDGLYFCTECSTQSQDFHVQESDSTSFYAAPQVFTKSIAGPRKNQTTEAREKAKENIQGRPWTIYEAYQYVILAQVDALVALGASPELKNIVYSIWATYLNKLGVAFCKKEKLVPDIVLQTGCFRQRELNRGLFEDPRNRNKKSDSRKEASVERDADDDGPQEFLQSTGIEFDAGKPHSKTDPTNVKWKRRAAVLSPEWMDMKKTITLCYIGLMITDPHILPHDIVSWVCSGKVPYVSVTHLLPADMMLSDNDTRLFSVQKFNAQILRKELSRILNYLSFYDIPSIDVAFVIKRFIDDLFLPSELKSPSVRLARLFPPLRFGWSVVELFYNVDIYACAYIITALNLMFGFDGKQEKELSECTRKLQSLIGPSPSLFVWEDWMTATQDRIHHEFDSCVELFQPLQKSKTRHLDSFLECFEKTGRGEQRQTMGEAAKQMTSAGNRDHESITEGLCSPLAQAINKFDGQEKEAEQKRQEKEKVACMEKFRGHTLCHIADVDTFRDRHQNILQEDGEAAQIILDFLKHRPKVFRSPNRPKGMLLNPKPVSKQAKKKSVLTRQTSAYCQWVPSFEPTLEWMVQICSRMIGCTEIQLSRIVQCVHECVATNNHTPQSPDNAPVMAASQSGPRKIGKKRVLKANRKKET